MNEKGFSLIELLTVVALMGVLSAMVAQSYGIYKDRAEHGSAIALFNQSRTALEGGKINSDNFPDEVMEVDEIGPTKPGGEWGQTLLNGLVIPEYHQVYVRHVPNCTDELCVEDVISVRHCQTDKIVNYTSFHSGLMVVNMYEEAGEACS